MMQALLRAHYSWWVGFRYLRSKKNSKFLSMITVLSLAGVCLGTTALIVVLSVMDGFEKKLRERLMSSDLHLLIQPKENIYYPRDKNQSAEWVKKYESSVPGLRIFPILSTEAILRTEKKVKGLVVKGVDDTRFDEIVRNAKETTDPSMMVDVENGEAIQLPGLILGQELADEMLLSPGSQVSLISPLETEGPLSQVPRLKRFVVQATYHAGTPEQELGMVFTRSVNVESFLRKRNILTHWEAIVNDFDQSDVYRDQIQKDFPQFKVQDWKQINSKLFYSLRLERVAMFIALTFIIIVASFNIVTTLTLMVLEKKREIAILKIMGAPNSEVSAIFFSEGLLIGITGTVLGLLLGGLICYILAAYPVIQLPDIYYDRSLPVSFVPGYFITIALSSLFIVFCACLYPARRAARLPPLEGIRYT